MEVKEEVGTLPGTVVMQGLLGQVSEAYQVSSRLMYASSCGLGVYTEIGDGEVN